jgi:hypothetical protein
MQTISRTQVGNQTKDGNSARDTRQVAARFPESPDPIESESYASLAAQPATSSAIVMQAFGQALSLGPEDLNQLVDVLSAGITAVVSGNLEQAEGMLYAQAHALQTMFMTLSLGAAKKEHMKDMEALMRLALKAQSQCRMTLETLSAIKNPPVVFARQANINNAGQQQVINGVGAPPSAHARTDSLETLPTELLEVNNGQRMDFRAPCTAGSTDPNLAALGEVDRPKDHTGKGSRIPKSRPGRLAPGDAEVGARSSKRSRESS